MSASLSMTHDFNAPPASVFAAWTDPDAILKWWGLPGYTNLSAAFDAREGGSWAVTSRSPTGETMTALGRVLKIVPNEMLVYDWRFDSMPDAAPSSVVTVRFTASGTGTLLHLEHTNLPGADQVPLFKQGWDYTLGNFAANALAADAA